jgi:hypothetical protein
MKKGIVKKGSLALVIPPTEVIPIPLLEMFIQHRKELKKPLTQTALELNVRKLEKMARAGINVIEAVEHSIASGYQGIFPAPKTKAPWVDARDVKRHQGEQLQGALQENGFNNFFDFLETPT